MAPTTSYKTLYPFDDRQLTSSGSSAKKSSDETAAGAKIEKNSDTLTLYKLTKHAIILKPKDLKTTVTQKYSVTFFKEVDLTMMKIYFIQTAGLYSLTVQIEDKKDQRMVYHNIFPPHTVAQFSDHAIYNPDEKIKDHGLAISQLNSKCKDLMITLAFSGPETDKTPTPDCFLEFTGKMDEALEEMAMA